VAAPTPERTPRLPAEVGGYAIDPATGLPVVPEAIGGPWWWVDQPQLIIDPSLRFTSEAPVGTDIDPDQGRVSLLAEYGSHAQALAVGRELAAAVGDPRAEAAWLEAAGQPVEAGFDWLGSEAATTPFVDVVDRWLVVSELAYRREFDPGPGLDVDPRYASPLTLALHDGAEALIVEEATSDDKHVAFDLACSGDNAALLTLQQDLADNAELYDMQPLWLEPGITDEQRKARRTLRLLDVHASEVLSTLPEDIVFQGLAQILRDAGDRGSTATSEAFEDLRSYIEGWIVATRPDLEPLAEFLDQDVVATAAREFSRRAALQVLAGRETRPANVVSGQFAASRFGAHDALMPWIMGEVRAYAGLGFEELTLSLGLFHGVAAGLGPMTAYLAENGCDEIRISFVDYGLGVSLLTEEAEDTEADE
jgi:hypothetical protein